ncbi:serine/threonine-protein kinase [Methylobacterium nodulans]|uniref:Serine/threonine protein kinase n=1 Tax=Methylobacterium nodulans (strain LMG 21967 / CNCM I-2342 / ORS 2060) TaxID=460265 RepID=B8ILY8_METNO|nr:serine/threonine-protein kinase [Methylobacterium nodulans]ACL56332.1 serine/threonine protein kinase [Methylobacterium nodulans ORS 2060]
MSEETVFLPPPSRCFIAPGTRLNDIYVIRSLIAAGGMGEVYRGEALATGDAVAIKVIKPELARNASALALFRREASALHNLYHEAIVRYFVFSIDPKLELPYLAMEFVDGVSLSDRLKEGPLDGPTLRLLLRRLAAGLQAAHELGIIHRDVSPDNVILPGGNVARAKLIDFGIARAPNADGTVIGAGFAGKYAYVSPEQLGLYGGEVTPQSDIYSLGLLMAHAARGSPLDMGSNHVDVVEKRRRVPDLAGVEEPIRTVLQAMLQPNPKDRPADMAAVAALAAVEPAVRRFPAAVLAAAGGGVAATVALAALAYLALPARHGEAPLPTPTPQVVGPAEPVVTPSAPLPRPEPPRSETQKPAAPGANPKPPPIIALPDPGEDPDLSPARPREPRREPPSPAPASMPTAEEVESFIRKYDGGDCFFITPVSTQPPDVMVDAFGRTTQPFLDFDKAFQNTLGVEPQISLRQVSEAQCPVVAFLARHYPQRDARAASITITADLLHSGQDLVGTVETRGDRSIDLLLVSDDGRVTNLGRYAKRTGEAVRFSMRVDGSGSPRPQLVLVVTSQKPLTSLRSGINARAEQLFRQIGDELDRDPRPAGIAVAYFKLGA